MASFCFAIILECFSAICFVLEIFLKYFNSFVLSQRIILRYFNGFILFQNYFCSLSAALFSFEITLDHSLMICFVLKLLNNILQWFFCLRIVPGIFFIVLVCFENILKYPSIICFIFEIPLEYFLRPSFYLRIVFKVFW